MLLLLITGEDPEDNEEEVKIYNLDPYPLIWLSNWWKMPVQHVYDKVVNDTKDVEYPKWSADQDRIYRELKEKGLIREWKHEDFGKRKD